MTINLQDLQKELLHHSKEGRGGIGDECFRLAIAIDQIGSFTRHITHDQILNPSSRSHGTRQSEVDDAGHAIIQVMTLAAVRGINIEEAINSALLNVRTKDFEKVTKNTGNSDRICGLSACTAKGEITAEAWVCPEGVTFPSGVWRPLILVAHHPQSDARLKQFSGIITDEGGMGCHAAIIAREYGIPCIVGVGNATKRIKDGQIIKMNTKDGTIVVVEERITEDNWDPAVHGYCGDTRKKS